MEEKFRLDKTAFKATNVKDADDHVTEWFLINHAYGTNSKTKVDRTVFSKRRR